MVCFTDENLALANTRCLEPHATVIIGEFDSVCYFIPTVAVPALARLRAIHIPSQSKLDPSQVKFKPKPRQGQTDTARYGI